MKNSYVLTMLGGMAIYCAVPAQAQVWEERGDAGALPWSAQRTVGFGPLRDIVGEARTNSDVDLYAIRIMDPQDFSATTLPGPPPPPGSPPPPPPPPGRLLNPMLYLFDASGRGVYANDNVDPRNPEALLPEHHPLGPISRGLYFLAITPYANRPFGGNISLFGNIGGTGIFGADRTNPVDSWWNTPTPDLGDYRIHLIGAGFVTAPVPEPGSIAFACGLGLVGLINLRKRRRH